MTIMAMIRRLAGQYGVDTNCLKYIGSQKQPEFMSDNIYFFFNVDAQGHPKHKSTIIYAL